MGASFCSYQIHPWIQGSDFRAIFVKARKAVDQVSAEGRVDIFWGELSPGEPIVGPRTPVTDHDLAVSINVVFNGFWKIVTG